MRLEDPLNDEHGNQQTRQHVREEDQIWSRIGVRAIGRRCAIHVALRNGVARWAETRRRHGEVVFG